MVAGGWTVLRMTAPSQRSGYFDTLYAANPDPWGFETRDYERDKYAATLSALPRLRFASCLEVGCSIGVLTELLGGRCDLLLGIDIAAAALAQAQHRCRKLPGVRFAVSELPLRAPTGPFDLIVLSEVLYYFNQDEIAKFATLLAEQMTCDAAFMLVHWLGPTPDYPLTGDAAVEAFEATMPQLTVLMRQRMPQYRLDVLGVRSV